MTATRQHYLPLLASLLLAAAFGGITFGLITGDWFLGACLGISLSLIGRWTSSLFASTDRYERKSIARREDVGLARDPDRDV